MRPTDPPPPPTARSSATLIEELCLALRDVGVSTRFLPPQGPPPDIEREVGDVRVVAEELRRRGVDVMSRLADLSRETSWAMLELYEESMAYPTKRPWVRDLSDGLRQALRCEGCGRHEFPERSQRLRLCDGCLDVLDAALVSARVREKMLLYRTYTQNARCEHAGDDTVLGVYPWSLEWSDDFPVGFCRTCIADERARRVAS